MRGHKTAGECEVQVVQTKAGLRLLQLSTFGSENRKSSGVTQTVQLNEVMAKELAAILHNVGNSGSLL